MFFIRKCRTTHIHWMFHYNNLSNINPKCVDKITQTYLSASAPKCVWRIAMVSLISSVYRCAEITRRKAWGPGVVSNKHLIISRKVSACSLSVSNIPGVSTTPTSKPWTFLFLYTVCLLSEWNPAFRLKSFSPRMLLHVELFPSPVRPIATKRNSGM